MRECVGVAFDGTSWPLQGRVADEQEAYAEGSMLLVAVTSVAPPLIPVAPVCLHACALARSLLLLRCPLPTRASRLLSPARLDFLWRGISVRDLEGKDLGCRRVLSLLNGASAHDCDQLAPGSRHAVGSSAEAVKSEGSGVVRPAPRLSHLGDGEKDRGVEGALAEPSARVGAFGREHPPGVHSVGLCARRGFVPGRASFSGMVGTPLSRCCRTDRACSSR